MHGGYGRAGRAAAAVGPEQEAAEAYDGCLTRGDVARRTHLSLLAAQQNQRILIGDRPLCSVLRPRYLSRHQADRLTAASSAVAGLMERAGPALLASNRMLDALGASD